MTDYTDDERDTIRTAAFGAMTLVSAADPGFLAMFKESMAGAKALASATGDLATVLRSGGVPTAPAGTPDQMKATVLAALRDSTRIMSARSQEDLRAFRMVIAAACEEVAVAHDGVTPGERDAVDDVKAAAGIT